MGSQVEGNIHRTRTITSTCRASIRHNIKAHTPLKRRHRHALILPERPGIPLQTQMNQNEDIRSLTFSVARRRSAGTRERRLVSQTALFICLLFPPPLFLLGNRSAARLGRSELIGVCLLAPFHHTDCSSHTQYQLSLIEMSHQAALIHAGLVDNIY